MHKHNQLKLNKINPCNNIQKFVNTFVVKNQQKFNVSQYVEVKYIPEKNKSPPPLKFKHKSSLTDWRLLYKDIRPQTQYFSQTCYKDFKNLTPSHKKNRSSSQINCKQILLSTNQVQNSSKLYKRPYFTIKNDATSRTAFDFYESPYGKQMQILGNLTSRIHEQMKAQINVRKPTFAQRKIRMRRSVLASPIS